MGKTLSSDVNLRSNFSQSLLVENSTFYYIPGRLSPGCWRARKALYVCPEFNLTALTTKFFIKKIIKNYIQIRVFIWTFIKFAGFLIRTHRFPLNINFKVSLVSKTFFRDFSINNLVIILSTLSACRHN